MNFWTLFFVYGALFSKFCFSFFSLSRTSVKELNYWLVWFNAINLDSHCLKLFPWFGVSYFLQIFISDFVFIKSDFYFKMFVSNNFILLSHLQFFTFTNQFILWEHIYFFHCVIFPWIKVLNSARFFILRRIIYFYETITYNANMDCLGWTWFLTICSVRSKGSAFDLHSINAKWENVFHSAITSYFLIFSLFLTFSIIQILRTL